VPRLLDELKNGGRVAPNLEVGVPVVPGANQLQLYKLTREKPDRLLVRAFLIGHTRFSRRGSGCATQIRLTAARQWNERENP
jgi:hypothetical protein